MTKTKTTTKTKVAVALAAGAVVAAAGFAGAFMAKEHPETFRASMEEMGILEPTPDLVTADIYLDESDLLNVVVKNVGKADVPEEEEGFYIYIYFDGDLEWTYRATSLLDNGFLTAGGSGVITPEILSNSAKIKVCTDYSDVVKETNEKNNCNEKYIALDSGGDGETSDGTSAGPGDGTSAGGDDGTSAAGDDQEVKCKDSDNGFMPYKYGVAEVGSVVAKDVCVLQADQGAQVTYVMACNPAVDPGCLLDEYVCKDAETIGHAMYECEDYCYKGECRQKPDTEGDGSGDPDPVDNPPTAVAPPIIPVDTSTPVDSSSTSGGGVTGGTSTGGGVDGGASSSAGSF